MSTTCLFYSSDTHSTLTWPCTDLLQLQYRFRTVNMSVSVLFAKWNYVYRTWILLAMSVTLTTHVSPPEHDHFVLTTPAEVSFGHIGSHWEHGCETAENDACIFKFFMMWLTITNMNKFTVWCTNTYKHTDTTRIQHTNVGLSQPHPNKCQSFNMSTQ